MGISPIGWLHMLGSLPAIPLAVYMLVSTVGSLLRQLPAARTSGSCCWASSPSIPSRTSR